MSWRDDVQSVNEAEIRGHRRKCIGAANPVTAP